MKTKLNPRATVFLKCARENLARAEESARYITVTGSTCSSWLRARRAVVLAREWLEIVEALK
jgi:hypothetical protein